VVTFLTAILTHLKPELVEAELDYLHALAPDSRFAVCHGGRREDFDRLPTGSGVFIEDPSLRGPHFDKSINDTLSVLYEVYVRDDPAVEFLYLAEYDQLILRADFEDTLAGLSRRHNAGLVAKAVSCRDDSNWPHHLRVLHDERLNAFIAAISVRDDPSTRWGCLGTGILLRRDALEAFCALRDAPHYYIELFLPTIVHHLGFRVLDADAVSDVYATIRWLPEYGVGETLAEARAGRTFVHPFKRLDQLASISQVRGSGTNSNTAARSG
jgi:hypothetical protein